ncbi:MAG TPA: hypothetical protein VMS22_14280 [Candidatus Eisenbacteria bacterium]|nr:hypothetical protein [Candidatus Eisenbacteria bacterium]
MTGAGRRRLDRWCGAALVGVGSFAMLHPELPSGPSLILLGVAVIERGGWTRRTAQV